MVSQHGADSHAWDPLAHLRVTTTAMGEAARLVDAIAHRHARGRWLATGGGGYDAYRVVPRMWSLVWLAGAHREVPTSTDAGRLAGALGRRGCPVRAGAAARDVRRRAQRRNPARCHAAPAETESLEAVALVRRLAVPRLLQVARDRRWWDPNAAPASEDAARPPGSPGSPAGEPVVVPSLDAAAWSECSVASRVVAALDVAVLHGLVAAAIADGAIVSAALTGTHVVGLAIAGPISEDGHRDLLALGVAPAYRRSGLARALLAVTPADYAEVTVAERDPVEPIDRTTRADDRPRAARTGRIQRVRGRRRAPGRRSTGASGRALMATPTDPAAPELPARDIVDVRLSAAIRDGGCPVCVVRARSERAMMDSVIAQHVLDIGFRRELERTQAFCRRHLRELILADRRGPGGTLGSSILYGAMIERRLEVIRDAVGAKGRWLRVRLRLARRRPSCMACDQGQSAVDTALVRMGRAEQRPGLGGRARGRRVLPRRLPRAVGGGRRRRRVPPVAEQQVARMRDLHHRLERFVDHSSHDRRHLMTDHEATATDEAARLLGGSPLEKP